MSVLKSCGKHGEHYDLLYHDKYNKRDCNFMPQEMVHYLEEAGTDLLRACPLSKRGGKG